MARNKIIFGGNVLIDLTGDTLKPDKVLKGYTGHGANGEMFTGTCEYDCNTQDATAMVAEVLRGKTFYARGQKMEGDMPNNGSISGEITSKDGAYTVPEGYHDGSGKVRIAAAERTKLIPANIRQGVTLLGVEGAMSNTEGEKRQEKTVTPSIDEQIVVPDDGYTCLTSVTVAPIPYTESDNAAGGITVTIG